MKEFIGRLIGFVFLGSFCVAGPLLLILALGTAVQRAALVFSGLHAEATVIGARQSGSTRPTYAPVFQFTASDGRSYTVSSDVYGKQSANRYGSQVQVLYPSNHPERARIDAFAQLWTLPLVIGVVGAGFSVVPGIVLVSWMRRREATRKAADTMSRGFRRLLGVLLIGGGMVLLAVGLGLISTDSSVNGSRILAASIGVLLAATGVLVGQWIATGGRLYNVFGGVLTTSMTIMFGWVAIFGDASNFHGSVSAGGIAVATSNSATPARIAFAVASILTGLAAVWAWKRAIRSR
jgi:hypothetical protein